MGRSYTNLWIPTAQLSSSNVSNTANGKFVARSCVSQQNAISSSESRAETGLVR